MCEHLYETRDRGQTQTVLCETLGEGSGATSKDFCSFFDERVTE